MEDLKTFVYVSSWDKFSGKKGLGLYQFDSDIGTLEQIKMESETLSCDVSYVDNTRHLLYVCNSTVNLPGAEGGGGQICVFKINPETGRLTEFDSSPSYGTYPCNLTQDRTGRYLIVANHSSASVITKIMRDVKKKYRLVVEHDDASVVLFQLDENGKIGEPLDVIVQPSLTSPFIFSRPHTVTFSPNEKFFAVCDNGLDRICMYRIDTKKKCLVLNAAPFEDIPLSTVRYCIFHPTLPYFYVNHEWGSINIRCFQYDEEGHLKDIGTVSSMNNDYVKLPHDEGQGFCIHPNGKYIYNAISGPEEIVVFAINEKTGMLKRIQNQKVHGRWLRSCTFSPDGRFMLTSCMMSGDLDVFSVGEDGLLTLTDFHANQPGAAWTVFYHGGGEEESAINH